ncbi:MAG: sporulation protein [Oscillospiraceae bacterium]|nr:sporulation protein [Oscillospiraceae bacterium]
MERFQRYLPLGAASCALLALVLCPDAAASSARSGLKLCAEMLVPSLLPFFIVSGLLRLAGLPGVLGRLVEPVTARLFGLSGAGASAMLLGLTGGYPLGAAAIGDLTRDGQLTPQEAERALGFCNNSGPAFLIGAAGTGVFHDRRLGLLLYATHVLAAITVGLLLTPRGKGAPSRERAAIRTLSIGEALPRAVRAALDATLTVCGFAVTFSVVTGLLDASGALGTATGVLAGTFAAAPQAMRALLTGLLELGSGIGAMQGLPATKENAALAAFLIGFGGVSVHCQTAAVTAGTGVRLKTHFFARVLHGIIAAGMMLVL